MKRVDVLNKIIHVIKTAEPNISDEELGKKVFEKLDKAGLIEVKPQFGKCKDRKYPNDPDFDEKVSRNRWEENFDETVAVIKGLSKEDNYSWCWARNWDCKYIDLRIDMRDGGFVLMNRNRERISLAQLKWQYNLEDDKEA